MNWTVILLVVIIEFLVSFAAFLILSYVGKFLYGKIKSSSFFSKSKLLNLSEYLPEEEFTTVCQVFYLIMIVIFVTNIVYILFGWREESFNLLILDVLVSLFVIVKGDIKLSENKVLFIVLVPFASLSYLFFANNLLSVLDLVHVFAFPYLIVLYYRKFLEYTETNSLGITILLLFGIIFVSFIVTMLAEHVFPLDSLVMVSNAFTSNGYSVLGNSTVGKIDSLVLVWSGFLLSGVGTATLAVAIIMKYANDKFDHLEEMVRKNRKK